MSEYKIKDLVLFESGGLKVTVDGILGINSYNIIQGYKGVPYNGGQNIPEPDEPDSVEINDCALLEARIFVSVNGFGLCDEIEVEGRHLSQIYDAIENKIDWSDVTEFLL